MKQAKFKQGKNKVLGNKLVLKQAFGGNKPFVRNKILGKEAQQAFGGRSFFWKQAFGEHIFCFFYIFLFLKQAFGEETFFLVEQAFLFKQAFGGTCLLGKKLC